MVASNNDNEHDHMQAQKEQQEQVLVELWCNSTKIGNKRKQKHYHPRTNLSWISYGAAAAQW